MNKLIIGVIAIVITIVVYRLALKIHKKFGYSFTVPVLTSTILIIVLLLSFRIPYETYMIGGDWIEKLLGPAVVALAYPLYEQRSTLKKLTAPILIGTFCGALVGVSTGVLLAKWAGFEETIIYSLTPKSVTTPVAMAVTESLGGTTPLAAVFVMIAGIGGVLMSSAVFQLSRIKHPIGRGVGMGGASHAIGTASAMESSQLEGSVSTIAMIVSAVIVSIITPLLVHLFM